MGFIKGGLFYFSCVLLLVSFLAMNFSLMVGISLSYDVIQPELNEVVSELVSQEMDINQIIEDNYDESVLICQNQSSINISQEGFEFEIDCEKVLIGKKAIADEGINRLVEQIYYQGYDCDYWSCLKDTQAPWFLFSEKSHDYWIGKFYLFLIISSIILLIMFFTIENKISLPIYAGGILVLSSLPFAKPEWFLFMFKINEFVYSIISVFFTKSLTVFSVMLFLGILSIIATFLVKFLIVGEKISLFFKKNKK